MNTSLEGMTQDSHDKHDTHATDKPKWWTASLDESWNRVKSQVLEEWNKVVASSKKLDHRLAEEALAFGHGAHSVYNKFEVWTKDFEARLQADWKDMTKAAERKWEDVREAVKLGWERAKGLGSNKGNTPDQKNPPLSH